MVSLLLVLVFVFFSDGEDDASFDDAAAEVNNLLVLVVVVGVRRAPFPPFPPPRKGLFSFLVFSPPPRQEGRDKSTLLGEEEEEEEENIIISLCVMLFFPVRKNFCWCFPTVFSNENFWAIDRRIFGLFFLLKRKLKNTSSRGTHHIITNAHTKKRMTTTKMTTTISRRTTLTLLFLFVASFLFGTLTVFVVQVYHANERFCVLFFFSIIFLKIIIIVAFWRLWFFFSHRRGLHTPLPFRRVVVYVAFCLSVGVDLGLKGVSLESSSSVSSFRRKRRIGGKNGFFSMMLGRTPTTSSKLSFRGVRKILTTKMFVSLL